APAPAAPPAGQRTTAPTLPVPLAAPSAPARPPLRPAPVHRHGPAPPPSVPVRRTHSVACLLLRHYRLPAHRRRPCRCRRPRSFPPTAARHRATRSTADYGRRTPPRRACPATPCWSCPAA